MKRTLPCVLMRAGTSRGPFFLRDWLPEDEAARDETLIGAIGASDLLQVDGVGGGSTLTDGVAGTAAPIRLNFLDAWGAVTGALFPTGRRIGQHKVIGARLGWSSKTFGVSKRTNLYATMARIDNKGVAAFVIPGGSPIAAGGSSTGAEFGMRHSF